MLLVLTRSTFFSFKNFNFKLFSFSFCFIRLSFSVLPFALIQTDVFCCFFPLFPEETFFFYHWFHLNNTFTFNWMTRSYLPDSTWTHNRWRRNSAAEASPRSLLQDSVWMVFWTSCWVPKFPATPKTFFKKFMLWWGHLFTRWRYSPTQLPISSQMFGVPIWSCWVMDGWYEMVSVVCVLSPRSEGEPVSALVPSEEPDQHQDTSGCGRSNTNKW